MDSQKTLLIEKMIPLAECLAQERFIAETPDHAQWLLYGIALSSEVFNQMDLYTGRMNRVIRLWQVGEYDVVLMDGELTDLHQTLLKQLKVDYTVIADLPDLSQPGLLLMDMDSTAIQIECIDEIAKLAGVGDEVSAVTERAMLGELDFEQSLRQRVGQLNGADASILEQVRSQLPLMPELEVLVATLKTFGWKIAIASGGFTYFSDHLQTSLGLDFAQSNTLEIIQGRLTGHVIGEVVSAQTKADILIQLSQQYGLDRKNTVAIGDGANDLLMMNTAGLGIAYHAKPKVEAQAQSAIRFGALGSVMCILSVSLMCQRTS